jgi:MFS family permease
VLPRRLYAGTDVSARLPQGQLRTLLSVWLLVGTSRWTFAVAVAVYAYGAGGPAAVGAVTAAQLLPALFAAPVYGHLIDRHDRARMVSALAGLEAVALSAVGALVLAGAPLAAIVVAVAFAGALATAPRPALQAQMPALAQTPDELTRATAAWGALDAGGFLLGSGAGGIAVAAIGPGGVVILAAAVCAAAALLALRLPPSRAIAGDTAVDEDSLGGAGAGLRALREIPALRVPIAILAGALVLEGTTNVQLVTLALDNLGMSDAGPGILFAVWGIGGLGGSAMVLWLLHRRGYGLALGVGAILFGTGLALTGAGGIAVAVVALVPVGLAFSLIEVSAMALVPRCADDAVVGRVYGLYELLYAGAGGVGALAAPPLIDWLGTPGSLALVGGVFAATGVLAWPRLAHLDAGQEDATRVRELLRAVPFLAPLPLPRLERLVRYARPLDIPAGETIVCKGEPGEDFFVIERGTVTIVEHECQQGTGDGFGEIALLRDIPRTATVRAATDVRLRALNRVPFLAAITDDAEVYSLTDSVVEEYLARPTLETRA